MLMFPMTSPTGRGCFTIGIVLALLLAALAYGGFRADPIDEGNAPPAMVAWQCPLSTQTGH